MTLARVCSSNGFSQGIEDSKKKKLSLGCVVGLQEEKEDDSFLL